MNDKDFTIRIFKQNAVRKAFTFNEQNAEAALRAATVIPESVIHVENVERKGDVIQVSYRMRGRGNKGLQKAEIYLRNAVEILFNIYPRPGVKDGKAILTSEGIQVTWVETSEEPVGTEPLTILNEVMELQATKAAGQQQNDD